MLTSGQCRIAAYLTDGDVICTDCAEKLLPSYDELYELMVTEAKKAVGRDLTWSEDRDIRGDIDDAIREAEESEGLRPLIQYELDSDETWQEYGLSCGRCMAELVEPSPQEEPEDEDTVDEDSEIVERVRLSEEQDSK